MSGNNSISADQLAIACASKMWSEDIASQNLGMKLGKVSPGCAQLTMGIQKYMLNGHKTCHGGYIFTFADSAFAFACNSHNQHAVAQHCQISYLRPSFEGDELTAEAVERTRAGRTGYYDITVKNQRHEIVAEFRGVSRMIDGYHLPQHSNRSDE